MQRYGLIAIALGLVLTACEQKKETPAAPASPTAAAPGAPSAGGGAAAQGATAGAAQEAKDIFAQRCTLCHGADGKGDGPTAAALNPKPRNYTDATWQASVTD